MDREQPRALIRILLAKSSGDIDRDDAALSLANYEGSEVLEALMQIVNDPDEDADLKETCWDSIYHIRVKTQ